MREKWAYLGVLLAAALVPIWAPALSVGSPVRLPFPGWPITYQGKGFTALPLTTEEQGFLESFPGRVAKFRDSERTYVLRWITEPTRRLHPASDCFRASGYRITHLPQCPVEAAGAAGCFLAERADSTLVVHERIFDDETHEYTDVSAWYWAAARGITTGPWWSVTTIIEG